MSKQGWSNVEGSQKWHYFKGDNVSLCKKWLLVSFAQATLDDSNHESDDNCKKCIAL